ncbi:MAG: M1 family metallopeptidase [Kofleriaceae bacterium]
MVHRGLAALAICFLASCPAPKQVPPPSAPAPVATAPAADPAPAVPDVPALRLLRDFLPTRYAARLELDPAKTDFRGSISITGTVAKPLDVIWLHGKNLTIAKASATKDQVELPVKVTLVGEELLKVEPPRTLEAGEWTLMMDYAGELDTKASAGAFRQTVADFSYIYTQLEALYARRVFPCFDEPDNKVPWKLTLDVPKKLVAVSNTPIASETPLEGDKKRVEFAVTKPLPTYLVAFGVGPFEIVDAGKSSRGTPVRVFTLAKRAVDGEYAAKTSAKLLDLAEDWFGTPYPYEKLDMLTIPVTVGFGAMENAGLITFTETLILHDAKASKERKHWWISVAAHEIAHQWFGNLVTMSYWDDIWLNEGFANWLETKIANKFEPSWRETDSELGMRNKALEADSLVTARKIRQPIDSNNDILNAFDGITYNKGASVLNMFEAYLGPEVFQRGVRDYLKARAWGNATSTDFATSLAQAAGKPQIATAFATFLEQPGAPEITATAKCDGAPTVELSQRRYVPPGAATPAQTKPWILPVCVVYEAGGKRAQKCTMLDGPTGSVALATTSCPRWVMPNADGRGYYRNAYTAQQLIALRDEGWKQLSWTERRAVFFDASAAARTGKLPLALALSFVPPMLAGKDRFTVPAAVDLPAGFHEWVRDDLRPKYEYWLRATFGAGARAVGFTVKDSDSLDDEDIREALVGTVAWDARDPKLVEQAVALADKWRDLPQSIRYLVLSVSVDAKPAVFDKVLSEVVDEPERTKRLDMLHALAAVRDLGRQSRAHALLLDPKVDIREAIWMLWKTTTEANRANSQRFFKQHADAIIKRLPADGATFSLGSLGTLFTKTCKADQREEVAAYVTKTFGTYPGAKRVLDQAIEDMDQCIAKRRVIEPELDAWLGGVRVKKDTDKKDKTDADDKADKKKSKKKSDKKKAKK